NWDYCFIASAFADFRNEMRSDVVAGKGGGGGGDVIIDGPAALEVAAATRTRAGLEIIKQKTAPAGGNALEELIDAGEVRVDGFAIDDRNPRVSFGDFANARFGKFREILLPIGVRAERGHPRRMFG